MRPRALVKAHVETAEARPERKTLNLEVDELGVEVEPEEAAQDPRTTELEHEAAQLDLVIKVQLLETAQLAVVLAEAPAEVLVLELEAP